MMSSQALVTPDKQLNLQISISNMVFQQWDFFNAFFVLVSSSVRPFPTLTPVHLKISWQHPGEIKSPLTLINPVTFSRGGVSQYHEKNLGCDENTV